jgi:uncharacterized protein DUF6744
MKTKTKTKNLDPMTTLGYVCFSENLFNVTLKDARKAAEKAGLDEEVRDIKARSAFIRAVQKLKERGAIEEKSSDGVLRHKLTDDKTEIKFQFSRYFVESQGCQYDSAAHISFDKKAGRIHCTNPQIKELAEKLYDECQGVFRTTDISSFILRVVRKQKTHRVPVRDAVYFFASTQKNLIDKIKNFYTLLGFNFVVLPVNHSSGESGSIIKAVITDFKNGMTLLAEEVKQLEAEDGLTSKIATNRLAELRDKLEEYRELAQSLRIDMKELFDDIGDTSQIMQQACMPLDALIAECQTGQQKLQPVVAKLMLASELLQPEFVEKFSIQIEEPKEPAKVHVHAGETHGVDVL